MSTFAFALALSLILTPLGAIAGHDRDYPDGQKEPHNEPAPAPPSPSSPSNPPDGPDTRGQATKAPVSDYCYWWPKDPWCIR